MLACARMHAMLNVAATLTHPCVFTCFVRSGRSLLALCRQLAARGPADMERQRGFMKAMRGPRRSPLTCQLAHPELHGRQNTHHDDSQRPGQGLRYELMLMAPVYISLMLKLPRHSHIP